MRLPAYEEEEEEGEDEDMARVIAHVSISDSISHTLSTHWVCNRATSAIRGVSVNIHSSTLIHPPAHPLACSLSMRLYRAVRDVQCKVR